MNASDPFAPQQGGAAGNPDGGWSGAVAPAPVPAMPPVRAATTNDGGRAILVEAVVVAMTAVVIAATGAPLAVVWWLIAPKVPIVVTSAGPVYVNYETERFMSADGWFVTLGAGAGLLVAIICWLAVRRHRGPAMLAGLVVGSGAAAGLASWLGGQIGRLDYDYLLHHAPTGSIFYHPIALGAKGGLLVEAVLAIFVYTLIAGCSRYAMLSKHRKNPDSDRPQYQPYDQPTWAPPQNQSEWPPQPSQPEQPSQAEQPKQSGQVGGQWPTATASFPVAASGQPVSPPEGRGAPASPGPDHSGPFQSFGFPRSNPAPGNPAPAGPQPGEEPIDPFARRSSAGPVDPFAPPAPGGADWPR